MVYVCALYICLWIFTFSFSHLITVYIEVPQEPGGLLINRHSIQSHIFVSLCVYECAQNITIVVIQDRIYKVMIHF